jgi:hypothetical protein
MTTDKISSAQLTTTKVYVQRTGNRIFFGTGLDGNVTITTNTFLSNDMYYDNLTVNNGATLFTNGFRVFVKGTLTNNGVIGMPAELTETVASATLSLRSDSDTGVFVGNAGNDNLSLDAVNDLFKAVRGYDTSTDTTYRVLKGGKPGAAGNSGTGNPGNPGGSGNAGNAGAAGSVGNYAPNANTVGSPGGKGGTGNPGNPGSSGNAGNPGTGQTGGLGGKGGGMVLVAAKTVTGSGTFTSKGLSGAAATGTASPGTAGNIGAAGNAGNAGATAPTLAGTFHPSGHTSHHIAASQQHHTDYWAHGNFNFYPYHFGAMTGHSAHPSGHNPSYTGGAGGAGGTAGTGGAAGNAGSGNAGNAGAEGTDGTVVLYCEDINTPLSGSKSKSIDLN